jgi:Uma2 family endonuclease
MSMPQSQSRYSVTEYLALERAAEERHEYLDGRVYAMAERVRNTARFV